MLRNRCVLVVLMLVLLMAAAGSVFAQSNAKEIMVQDPAKLAEILKSAAAPIFDKAKACQRLAVVGAKDAIAALVALLPDEKLNLYARFGLEGIPDPAVDAALREAAGRLQGRQLVGVLDSIGQRKDAAAVGLLKGFLGNADAALISAAAGALGRIGTPEAAGALSEALGKDSPVKGDIADGCLACAEGLAAAGKKAEALALYEAVAKAGAAKHIQVAALDGQFRLQQAEAKELLLAQIRHADEAFFNLALAVARTMPGADVTAALADELAKLPAERQALLLRALGDRKEAPPLALILEASKSAAPAVREAAVYLLAKQGDASAVTVLLDAALGEGEVAQAAKEGLKTLAGQEVDAAIAARLAAADAKAKPILFELIGARRINSAAPTIRQAMSDSNEAIRQAAIAAMGQLVELKDLDVLSSRALGGGNAADAAKAALKTAALRMADREATAAKLGELLKKTAGTDQAFLFDLVGTVSGKNALQIVVTHAKSSDQATKDAATRVLGEWVNADAAEALLGIAKNDPETKYQVRALRGYIRIARQLQLPNETRLAMFCTAMETAKRNEEKQIALDILTRIPSAATLKLAVSYLGNAELKNSAADAAVKIAPKIANRQAKAVAEAMQKVLDAGISGEVGNRAQQILDQAKGGAK